MSNGKIRREVLVGSLLLVLGLFVSVVAYFLVRDQVVNLDLQRIDVRASIINLTGLLTALSVVALFLGAVGGYVIGKYMQRA